MNPLHIDESYSRQVQMNWPALYAGEDVVWRGKPLRSKYTMKDAKLTLTGIPVAVFIAFWMSMALRIPKEGSPRGLIAWLFPAFGMIFVLQALYLLAGHYLRTGWNGKTSNTRSPIGGRSFGGEFDKFLS
jgi:hypothetical protein